MKNNKSRIEQHLGGLLVLALISEVGYDLLEAQSFSAESLADSQSAIITLLLAFLGLIAIERWRNDKPLWMWSAIALTAIANYIMRSNYKFVGVLLVYAFYFYLQNMEHLSYLKRFCRLLLIFVLYIPLYHWARYDFCGWSTYVEKLIGGNTWWYLTHILIAGFLATYTGQLGFYSKKFKKIYRWFYPVHLLILGIIWKLIGI